MRCGARPVAGSARSARCPEARPRRPERAGRGVRVGDPPPGAVDVVDLVPVGRRVLPISRLAVELRQRGILGEERRRVDANAGDAAVEPEAQHRPRARRRTSWWPQLRSGCCGVNRCRYHSPGRPSASAMRVQALPPKMDDQPFGGSSPSGPRPARNQKRSRRGCPDPRPGLPGTRRAGPTRGSGRCRRSCGCRRRAHRR